MLLLFSWLMIDSYTNPVDVSSPTVNVSNFQPSQKSNTVPPHSGYSSRGRGRGRNFRGGRRGWNPNSGRPVCQICGIQGHVAKRCYYRFDADFIPSAPMEALLLPHSVHLGLILNLPLLL